MDHIVSTKANIYLIYSFVTSLHMTDNHEITLLTLKVRTKRKQEKKTKTDHSVHKDNFMRKSKLAPEKYSELTVS